MGIDRSGRGVGIDWRGRGGGESGDSNGRVGRGEGGEWG